MTRHETAMAVINLAVDELMARAAWLYHVGGLNQEAAAARLGVTRARVNKLLQETEHPDGKIRMQALKAIGEIDGVDAFKKRTEMTVQVKPIEEVEKELLDTLNVLETRFLEVDSAEITPDDE